jgi:hypothetical protein
MLKSLKRLLLWLYVLGFATSIHAAAQASVRIESPAAQQGLRGLEEQTASAVVRDYLQSWTSLKAAFEQNRPDLLNTDFSGTARDKLGETIQEQNGAGVSTQYQDSSHDIQIVFHSPEGLSVELTDTVEYDMQVLDHGKPITNQHMRTRYVVVLTPAEARWKVHIFQATNQ